MRVMCVIHVIHVISLTLFHFVVGLVCYGLMRLVHVIRVKRHIPFPHRIFLRSVLRVRRVIHVIHVISPTPFPKIIGVLSVMRVMCLIHVIHVMSHTSVLIIIYVLAGFWFYSSIECYTIYEPNS